MSAAESMATPQWPTSPSDRGSSEVAAHQRRHVERHGQAGAAGAEQHLVPLVGLPDVAEPGELPDRPRLAPVAGRVQAAGERELARPADPVRRLLVVLRPVDRVDVQAGQGGEVSLALGRLLVAAPPALAPGPALF